MGIYRNRRDSINHRNTKFYCCVHNMLGTFTCFSSYAHASFTRLTSPSSSVSLIVAREDFQNRPDATRLHRSKRRLLSITYSNAFTVWHKISLVSNPIVSSLRCVPLYR